MKAINNEGVHPFNAECIYLFTLRRADTMKELSGGSIMLFQPIAKKLLDK